LQKAIYKTKDSSRNIPLRGEWTYRLPLFSLILFLSGLALPLWEARANRVAPAESVFFFESLWSPLGLLAILLPGLILLLALLHPKGAFFYFLLPSVALLSFALQLAILSSQLQSSLGPFGRISPAIGCFLLLLAGMLPLIGDKPPRWSLIAAWTVCCFSLLLLIFFSKGGNLGVLIEAVNQQRRLFKEILNHLKLTFFTLLLALIIGLPLAAFSYRYPGAARWLFPFMNFLQTLPSIALFGLMIAPLAFLSRRFPLLRDMGIRGIGNAPALIALVLYALYPIIRYSFSGFQSVDGEIIDAAKGMGMSSRQLRQQIILPLSLPVILNGIRVAAVQTLGNVTLAKLIGGNGLGVFVFEGLGQASSDMVLLGMLCIILLTLAVDKGLQVVRLLLTPKALRSRYLS